MRAHRQRVAMHEVLRQHVGRDAVQLVRFIQVQKVGENFEQVRAALGDVIRQEINSVGAHQAEQGVVPFFEVRLPELEFDGSELPLQNTDEEITASACWL